MPCKRQAPAAAPCPIWDMIVSLKVLCYEDRAAKAYLSSAAPLGCPVPKGQQLEATLLMSRSRISTDVLQLARAF
ncbi:hypothetical protein CONPUDRAFT_160803 [Coniophora puteana RWD-64-598 SS2]|uniref:Uncharacterized protein n=1 Tax=Coniophora puteana (strain RWD-64-598) TaxID=741705 RepID=R7SD08_CONPW|nr:uncharacterized protein CONPUDRAFT_160803 [Coniophora puteana RWD-64-598 SS2]EIW73720.1 hypothetical protein CONPUDRAFT_160803 [Coniophora puteana RWD-64-598 SS2]